MWIDQRAGELMASGWKQEKLAKKRAAREWRTQTPQHKSATRRNNTMHVARLQRLVDAPASANDGSSRGVNVSIEAKQFTAGAAREVALFAGVSNLIGYVEDEIVTLLTARGPEVAKLGDYVVKGANGAVCVMQRATFEAVFAPGVAPAISA